MKLSNLPEIKCHLIIMANLRLLAGVLAVFMVFCAVSPGAASAQGIDSDDSKAISRRLGSPDPISRQLAAEELARLAAIDQKKLLEGYYLQEKDRKVRLALEWALYRVGKNDALFRIVRDLDSSRQEQAIGYLKQLDSPGLLYLFLKQQDNSARITVGLLEALGQLGDSETLELIKPLRDSFVAGVAEAAEVATDKIEARLAQAEPAGPTRPRTVQKQGENNP